MKKVRQTHHVLSVTSILLNLPVQFERVVRFGLSRICNLGADQVNTLDQGFVDDTIGRLCRSMETLERYTVQNKALLVHLPNHKDVLLQIKLPRSLRRDSP